MNGLFGALKELVTTIRLSLGIHEVTDPFARFEPAYIKITVDDEAVRRQSAEDGRE